MLNIPQFVSDFVGLWNEPDATRRRESLEMLWAPGGTHFSSGREARGYDALFDRISGSHERSVARGGNRFAACDNAEQLKRVLKFNWRMLDGAGNTAAIGLEVIELDELGRIAAELQFIEPGPIW